MDVIARTAFGLKVDSQKDKNNKFVRMAKKMFEFGFLNPLIVLGCKYAGTLTNPLSFFHFDFTDCEKIKTDAIT